MRSSTRLRTRPRGEGERGETRALSAREQFFRYLQSWAVLVIIESIVCVMCCSRAAPCALMALGRGQIARFEKCAV